jgi:hypothetical protein
LAVPRSIAISSVKKSKKAIVYACCRCFRMYEN